MQGVDYIFHAAALKQVPSCEFFPLEVCQNKYSWNRKCFDLCGTRGGEKSL